MDYYLAELVIYQLRDSGIKNFHNLIRIICGLLSDNNGNSEIDFIIIMNFQYKNIKQTLKNVVKWDRAFGGSTYHRVFNQNISGYG